MLGKWLIFTILGGRPPLTPPSHLRAEYCLFELGSFYVFGALCHPSCEIANEDPVYKNTKFEISGPNGL